MRTPISSLWPLAGVLLLATACHGIGDILQNGLQGPSHSWDPARIDYAVVNFADPPPASPPPVPEVVWQTAEEGLSHRDGAGVPITRRRRTLKSQPRRAAAGGGGAASGGAPGGGLSGVGAQLKGLLSRRRRSLKAAAATPFRSSYANTTASGGTAAGGGGGGAFGAGRTGASGKQRGYGFGGIGLARQITGANQGFDGIGVPETRIIPEDLSLAVGNTGAIHTANSLIRFYRVDISGKKAKHGIKDPIDSGSFLKQVWMQDFFYPVTKRFDGSNGCDQGVFSAAVAYDKWVGRYMISAICADWLNPRILLGVSTVDSVTDYWTLYSAPADNEPTSWRCANGKRAYPDYSQARGGRFCNLWGAVLLFAAVGYNRDGIFVTWVAICSEDVDDEDVQYGAMIYAFPKWAVYGGNNPRLPMKRFWVPVFTAQDLCVAVRDQAPFRLPEGGDCGAAFRQLQPVMPQTAMDVRAGETFFVLDFYYDQLSRRNFLLVSLIATGTLWDHSGIGSPEPYILGRFVDRGEEAYISEDVFLQQPVVGNSQPELDAGAVNPRGYWNGGAAYANGRIYIADRTDVEDPPNPPTDVDTPTYNPRPAVYWAWVVPTFTAYGPCACYWNFNWGYGFGWVWDTACYNPVTGVYTGGGGGAYKAQGRKLKGTVLKPVAWAAAPTARDRSNIIGLNGTAGGGAPGKELTTSGSSGGSWADAGAAPRRRKPNVIYSAAAGAVEHTVRTEAPPDSRVIVPPTAAEVAAAAVKPESITPEMYTSAAAAAAQGPGSWSNSAPISASGKEGHGYRDVYMQSAYFGNSGWGVDIRCRFDHRWNIRNKARAVTLLATVIKSGVITHGSAAGTEEVPLGLAYPQVAVRGGTMLVTYTFAGPEVLPPEFEEEKKKVFSPRSASEAGPGGGAAAAGVRAAAAAPARAAAPAGARAAAAAGGRAAGAAAGGRAAGAAAGGHVKAAAVAPAGTVVAAEAGDPIPGYVPGTMYPDDFAYPGVGFTVIHPEDLTTTVSIAWQNNPSYGPISQDGPRFGDYAGIDIHPISGRIWSANLCVWAPSWTVDGETVISNAGARITIFS
ncbi:MAG: hypothetical protein J3K34DRAFT_524975 [Monoraphidium minutum]|nr:MAG: hypothetical protein J3K34DRAFT_524975 [Monoraphidium minutum]